MIEKRLKIGDIILLKNGEKSYLRASVAKSVDGYYYLQGSIYKIDGQEDPLECYCVEIEKTGEKIWAKSSSLFEYASSKNYICLQNGKRVSEPFPEIPTKKISKKQNIGKTASLQDSEDSENSDVDNTLPPKSHIHIDEFEEFMTLGRLRFMDNIFSDGNGFKQGLHHKSSTDISPAVPYTSTEIDRYLKSCWNYGKMKNILPNETKIGSFCGWKGDSANMSKQLEISAPWVTKIVDSPSSKNAKINWCYVCGKRKSLTVCESCPAAFHKACVGSLLLSKKRKLRSSKNKFCPHCSMNNAIVFGDIVWDKMKSYPWWPARVLSPTEQPECLKIIPSPHHVPIQYFGKVQYAWADSRNLLHFLPTHTIILKENGQIKEKVAVTEALAHFK